MSLNLLFPPLILGEKKKEKIFWSMLCNEGYVTEKKEWIILEIQQKFTSSDDRNFEFLILCTRVLSLANFLFIVQIAFVNKSAETV